MDDTDDRRMETVNRNANVNRTDASASKSEMRLQTTNTEDRQYDRQTERGNE